MKDRCPWLMAKIQFVPEALYTYFKTNGLLYIYSPGFIIISPKHMLVVGGNFQ